MMTWGQPRLMRKIKETVSECRSQMFDLVLEKSEIRGRRDRFLTYRELTNTVEGRIDRIIQSGIMLPVRVRLLQKIEPDRFRRIE
jgi:hypothetical protein